MIRCYYGREIHKDVIKAARVQLIFCACFVIIPCLLLLIGMSVTFSDIVVTIFCIEGFVAFSVFLCLFYRLIRKIERMALQCIGDTIVLDDNEIRLIKENGTQITLPRKNLKIKSSYNLGHNRMFKIWNPLSDSNREIVLTSNMENAAQLVNTIEPGLWELLEREVEMQLNFCKPVFGTCSFSTSRR